MTYELATIAWVLSARWVALDRGINLFDTFHWTIGKLLPSTVLEATFGGGGGERQKERLKRYTAHLQTA